MFSSYIHTLDGWEVNSIASEDYDFYFDDITLGYSEVEYSASTFLGGLYSNWSMREYHTSLSAFYAQALLANRFVIGRRCASGTFIWLGLQGRIVKTETYPPEWVIQQDKYNHTLAYCDSNGYGTDPFTSKSNNVIISNVIKVMIDKFYEEDPGGAVLDFDTDVRWVSGPTGSYSSISSSSTSSSSLSSSSVSSSESSISSISSSSESSA